MPGFQLPEDSPLQKATEGSEALGMIIAQYYNALVRGGVPAKVAATLTYGYADLMTKRIYGLLPTSPAQPTPPADEK